MSKLRPLLAWLGATLAMTAGQAFLLTVLVQAMVAFSSGPE